MAGVDDPARLLDDLKNSWKDVHGQTTMKMGKKSIEAFPVHLTVTSRCGAQVQCTTTCATWSDFATSGSQQILNYFLLTHDFTCTPFKWTDDLVAFTWPVGLRIPIDQDNPRAILTKNLNPQGYSLRLRYLDPSIDPVQYENDASEASSGSWQDDNSDWSAVSVNSADFIRSIPQETQTMDSYTDSISVTIGANAGLMGEAPMAGISASVTTSSSHSWSVPSVQVQDSMDAVHDSKFFKLNTDDARSHTFQMTVQELVTVKDDRKGSRVPNDPNRVYRNFELQIWPELEDTNEKIQYWRAPMAGDVHDDGDMRWVLHIPAPQLPIGVDAVTG